MANCLAMAEIHAILKLHEQGRSNREGEAPAEPLLPSAHNAARGLPKNALVLSQSRILG